MNKHSLPSLAANPGYQPPAGPPGAPASAGAPDYSAYYQQYQQQPPPPGSQQPVPGQSQQQPASSTEEYAQQYAAYYAQYGYSVPPASGTAPSATAPGSAPYNAQQYHDYYAQQASVQQPYSYPTSAPGVQAPTYAYSSYPAPGHGAQQQQQPPFQPAPGAPLTSYPYSYQQQQQQQQALPLQQQQSFSSSFSTGQAPIHTPYPPHSGPPHSGYGKQAPHSKPAFDYQAFQRQKHQEAEQRKHQYKDETDPKDIQLRQRLGEATLGDNGSVSASGVNGNMPATKIEKPAYLSVKSKKVKPLMTNVLESKESQPSPTTSRDGWPPSLQAYVQRVFEALSEEDHKAAQEELRGIVAKHHAQGKLWDVDWDNMEIPSKYRRKKSRKLSPSPELETLGAEERLRRERRMRRFEDDKPDRPAKKALRMDYAPPVYNADVIDWDEYTIVGTSTKLEKNYLRLTSAPDPATVRPVHILKETLELLKEKWRQDQNYAYICNQFKSVRQDLTVQRIKNDFTVTVYEIHARIALEKGDLGEYNQCQTQLRQLYEYNLKGHVMEFTAYRILYLLHTRNPSDIIAMLASLTPVQKEDPAVKHALQVRTALASSNYHVLFKLYLTAPNMGGYLMDQFVERERVQAMKTICKAYRPNIEVAFLASTLGFMDITECLSFLKSIGIMKFLNEDSNAAIGKKKHQYLDTKMALPYVMEAGKKYQMIDIKGQI
ncbi:hypothetical protein BGZ99_008864 [Dissophora globulifera]|uniref:PCI domain-containing protein n=1 Tax=Dissophora globulifera TaxID=979702 RepID=A0A9P6RVI1_9FUNG|nr:hypothetical protein BGZ99_008864 [Dissophora globulifera]